MAQTIENVQVSFIRPNGFDDLGAPKYRSLIIRHVDPQFSDEGIVALAAAMNTVLPEPVVDNIVTTKTKVY